MGVLFPGIDGRPNDAGPNIADPTGGGGGDPPPPPTNPSPTGDGTDVGVGREISCSSIEITPETVTVLSGNVIAFLFKVYYSDGTTNDSYTNGLPGATVNWFSENDDILKFNDPGIIGLGPNGYGYQAIAGPLLSFSGIVVSVEYSHPGTKDSPSRSAGDNWYAPCSTITALATVKVVDYVTGCRSPSDLPELSDFIPTVYTSKSIARLEIAPVEDLEEDAFVEVGDVWPFRLIAVMENGFTQNVALQAMWSSTASDVATVNDIGNATGVAAGLATIKGTYKGFTASAVIEVAELASAATAHGNTYTVRPIDTVIVLDRSASMNIRDPHGFPRVNRAKDAALQFVLNSDITNDQIALVSFAGTYIAGETELDNPQTAADATLDQELTTDKQTIREAINRFSIRGECGVLEWEGTRCATGIGSGLEAARAEINSDRHEYSNKKMVLLFTDGWENINKPTPSSVANLLKEEGTLVCVVALDTPLNSSDLEALATPGLYFPTATAYELAKKFGEIPHYVNYGEYGYAFYE